MIVTEKNEGQKIAYTAKGTVINFDEMISVNLAKFQKDTETVIDVSLDEDMNLTTGLGRWYVANIVIPPRKYDMVDTGEVSEDESPIFERVAKPLSMDEVQLILWTLPENYLLYFGGAY